MTKARILVIESDPTVAERIERYLARSGYEILAEKVVGEKVTHLASKLRPDLVLIDIDSTEGPDGIKAAERIKEQMKIPVIILTEWVNEHSLHQAKITDPISYILKPLDRKQLENTIELALYKHKLEEKLNELTLLRRANQIFISTLDLDQVLTTILEEVRQLLDVVACSAWLVDTEAQELVCRQVTDPQSATVRGWRLPLGTGLVGWVAETGQSSIVPDIRTDTRHFKGVDDETGLKLRSILSVPLCSKDKVIGVIQVVDETVERFTQADQELVEALAATAAIAVENARLYEETDALRRFNEDIVNSVEEGIVILDANRKITFINPKGANLLGYEPKELVGRDMAKLVSSENEALVKAEFAQRQEGVGNQYEITMITKDGDAVPVIVSDRPLFDGGRFSGVLSVYVDITRRKKADEILRKLSRAVEQSADHMIITDKSGVIEYVNPAFQKITGFTGRDVIGKTPRILKSGQHDHEFYQNLWNTVASGHVFREMIVNKKKNGALYYEEQTITPIKDTNGNITHFVATGRDITERRLTERTLEQAVEVLQQRNRELDALNRAGRRLSSSLDLDEVLSTILEEARNLLGIVACSIWLADPMTVTKPGEVGELVCRLAVGPQSEIVQGWRLAPGEGLAGWVAKTGESLILSDIQSDERHFKGVDEITGLELRSILSVPLKRVNQGVIGVLHVLDTKVNRFNIMDLTLVESLATTATVAIENAQLFERAQQDAKTKAVLLDEINHRVKNNLSAIIGLLFAEQSRIEVKDHKVYPSIMKNLINRIRGLATVHSLLSASEWAPLALDQLAEQVIHSALQVLPPDMHIAVDIHPSSVQVTPAQAHYLALVMNELTINTVKHGLPNPDNEAKVIVRISLSDNETEAGKTIEFLFKDNGAGYPDDILQLTQNHSTVGFDLIHNIVTRSLRGKLILFNDDGAVTLIQFQEEVTKSASNE